MKKNGDSKRIKRILAATCLIVMLCVASGFAAPSIKVLPTTQSVEKGGVFQIRVEISTIESIRNISVVPIATDGFLAEPMVTPGLKTDKDETAILIDHLDAGHRTRNSDR